MRLAAFPGRNQRLAGLGPRELALRSGQMYLTVWLVVKGKRGEQAVSTALDDREVVGRAADHECEPDARREKRHAASAAVDPQAWCCAGLTASRLGRAQAPF